MAGDVRSGPQSLHIQNCHVQGVGKPKVSAGPEGEARSTGSWATQAWVHILLLPLLSFRTSGQFSVSL